MNIYKNKWFTIVELIIVIVILTILWTIAFISLQWYSANARDSARVSDLSSMKTSLELFQLEAWKYPIPTSGVDITYSWSNVWNQWSFWDSVFKNLSKLDKIPVDPSSEKEYTYSTTQNRDQYELWWVVESDILVFRPPITSPYQGGGLATVNAWVEDATAIVTGNYNWLMTKTTTWTLCNVISIPTIITNDVETSRDLLEIVNNERLVFNWFKNLPATFRSSKFTVNWWFNFRPNNLVAYSDTGSCQWLLDRSDPLPRLQLCKWLQDSYTWTTLKDNDKIKKAIDSPVDLNNPSKAALNNCWNLVNNNFWWHVEVLPGINENNDPETPTLPPVVTSCGSQPSYNSTTHMMSIPIWSDCVEISANNYVSCIKSNTGNLAFSKYTDFANRHLEYTMSGSGDIIYTYWVFHPWVKFAIQWLIWSWLDHPTWEFLTVWSAIAWASSRWTYSGERNHTDYPSWYTLWPWWREIAHSFDIYYTGWSGGWYMVTVNVLRYATWTSWFLYDRWSVVDIPTIIAEIFATEDITTNTSRFKWLNWNVLACLDASKTLSYWVTWGITATWSGLVSTDWNNSSNWNWWNIPSSNDDVIINWWTNQPTLNLSSWPVSIKSLTIWSSSVSRLTMNYWSLTNKLNISWDLTIWWNWTITHTINTSTDNHFVNLNVWWNLTINTWWKIDTSAKWYAWWTASCAWWAGWVSGKWWWTWWTTWFESGGWWWNGWRWWNSKNNNGVWWAAYWETVTVWWWWGGWWSCGWTWVWWAGWWVIKLNVWWILSVNWLINSNWANWVGSSVSGWGWWAGWSIWIVANTINGSSNITANWWNGGNWYATTWWGWGGWWWKVLISAVNENHTWLRTSNGGTWWTWSNSWAAWLLYIVNWTNSSLDWFIWKLAWEQINLTWTYNKIIINWFKNINFNWTSSVVDLITSNATFTNNWPIQITTLNMTSGSIFNVLWWTDIVNYTANNSRISNTSNNLTITWPIDLSNNAEFLAWTNSLNDLSDSNISFTSWNVYWNIAYNITTKPIANSLTVFTSSTWMINGNSTSYVNSFILETVWNVTVNTWWSIDVSGKWYAWWVAGCTWWNWQVSWSWWGIWWPSSLYSWWWWWNGWKWGNTKVGTLWWAAYWDIYSLWGWGGGWWSCGWTWVWWAGWWSVKLLVWGTLSVNGVINANGSNWVGTTVSWWWWWAGWSIWINTNTINWASNITANGWNWWTGYSTTWWWGWWWGWKITVTSVTNNYTWTKTVTAGSGWWWGAFAWNAWIIY